VCVVGVIDVDGEERRRRVRVREGGKIKRKGSKKRARKGECQFARPLCPASSCPPH
jgi:hypothetical protein